MQARTRAGGGACNEITGISRVVYDISAPMALAASALYLAGY